MAAGGSLGRVMTPSDSFWARAKSVVRSVWSGGGKLKHQSGQFEADRCKDLEPAWAGKPRLGKRFDFPPNCYSLPTLNLPLTALAKNSHCVQTTFL